MCQSMHTCNPRIQEITAGHFSDLRLGYTALCLMKEEDEGDGKEEEGKRRREKGWKINV